MPDLKISQLPVATTPLAGTELVPIVQGGTTDQTTVQAIMTSTVPSGTANGVLYLNGSKVATSGSALTFNSQTLNVVTPSGMGFQFFETSSGNTNRIQLGTGSGFGYINADAGAGPIALAFQVAGSEQMRLTSTGLGIGTSSPSAKLDISGTSRQVFYVSGSDTEYRSINAAGSVFAKQTYNAISFDWGLSNTFGKMVLDSSGNLGIGVTSPVYDLHVGGTAPDIVANNSGANETRIGITASNTAAYISTTYSGTGIPLIFTTDGIGAAGNEKMRLESSGNLGLGVTPSASDTATLQIPSNTTLSGGGSAASLAHNAYYNAGWKYISTAGASLYQEYQGQHIWYTAPSGTAGNAISFTQAMTLDASGNLGIGTTDTTAVRFKVQSGSDPIVFLSGFNGAGTMGVIGANPLAIYTNGTERARITSTGNVVAGGSVALATTATDGFLYVPTCAGTPTGTPTAITGMAPIVVNTTNNKLYFYSGGAWRDAGP